MRLGSRKRLLLEFIRDHGGDHSVRHMTEAIGLSSTASTHSQLQSALEAGYLELKQFDCDCQTITYRLTPLGHKALKE